MCEDACQGGGFIQTAGTWGPVATSDVTDEMTWKDERAALQNSRYDDDRERREPVD